MRGIVLSLATLVLSGAPVLAQTDPFAPPRPRVARPTTTDGVQMYDPQLQANMRYGVSCQLRIEGRTIIHEGLCNLGRGVGAERDRTTLIQANGTGYKIVRTAYDNHQGMFYLGTRAITAVKTEGGNCWVSADDTDATRFCAK